tara:strand:- start:107479 stop:111387 length:3909 start_codon:yes stop_codon:yes gene_type:complete
MLIRFFVLFLLLQTAVVQAQAQQKKQILMMAGPPSHGYGSHEHFAGLKILEESINASTDGVHITLVRGWPEDDSLIDNADSIVIYSDGGKKHIALDHRDQLRKKLADGCGLVCIHYAVEMLPDDSGKDWLEFLGGHFEVDYSVNPHWVGDFKSLPDHPITRGVKPFATNDEWYFHLRFLDSDRITPILSAVAPEDTMRRPDGHHSGNPHVRKSVAAGEMQTVAWAYERPDGGRSFGFTGGHFHWNWANEDMRRLVTNAIRWSAGEEIEATGSSLSTETIDLPKLKKNQDYEPDKRYDEAKVIEEFKLQSSNMSSGSEDAERAATNAISGLAIPDDLEVTLVASEPDLKSLTNLDIDDRGRIWVCEVMNYRRNDGARPEGDRILILEDTTGDGVADDVKTFYQGHEVDTAMGICVLGNQVIVTASPNVWKFIDDDGDDRPDRKELMFTETGQPQHDHSAHSFLFGPDGKLYWNFGNTGGQVKDANGNTVIDVHGRPVVDNGSPFYGGMPFRCDLDGSNFEVLAHNFRNNWETTIDSFGSLWQSDNDDDGNQGTRINFVMEQGNYGYRDELTGAGWRDHRIGMEKEIPRRHWHLNDPGVVPNLLQTGAGSPSGICMYEGRLLPERFWDQVIHCDPGPNVVRAYPVKQDGAGYTATIEPLMTGETDKWFRPADVCVAPDGSLFVTDWYDPGVGGHRQGDLERGRLFRIAPPGVPYKVPTFDFSTPTGAADALKSPNASVRFKAWMALKSMDASSVVEELNRIYADSNPRLRARAAWLLSEIVGAEQMATVASGDQDPDIRIVGIRIAKQNGRSLAETLPHLADDSSPAVRRELAIALRFDKSPAMPSVWAKLARHYEGNDRWYLEALGIGSDLRAAECYRSWAAGKNAWTESDRDIVWRLRAPQSAEQLGLILADPRLPLAQTDKYFRSLEYHTPEVRNQTLASLINAKSPLRDDQAEADAIIVRAAERIDGGDHLADPHVKAAIDRHIQRSRGTTEYLQLLKTFQSDGLAEKLADIIVSDADDSMKVEAAAMLSALPPDGPRQLNRLVRQSNVSLAANATRLIALMGDGRAWGILTSLASDPDRPFQVRREAVSGLARQKPGQHRLIELAASKQLLGDTRMLAGALLARSNDDSIRERATKLLPQPQTKNQKPLAPLDKLANMKGDAESGMKLFRGAATCANCHVIGDHGKEVGPNLSEIGSKLSREAMLVSILDPSAGVSHNYEQYSVLTGGGQVITGVKVSESDQEVVIRTAEAIDRRIPQDDIEQIKKSEKSIMPENLHHAFDQQGLIDIVEYMIAQKKKS